MFSSAASAFASSSRSRVAAASASRVGVMRQQTRSFGVRKNYYIEKWNGVRENTTKEFSVSGSNFMTVFMAAAGIPFGIYLVAKSEEESRQNLDPPRTFNMRKNKMF